MPDDVKLTDQFVEFLKNTPAALEHFLRVIEIYATQGPVSPTMPDRPPHGPQPAVEGATHELVTQPLSRDEIDQLKSDMADAVVIEKLKAYVSGFLKAVTMVGGA